MIKKNKLNSQIKESGWSSSGAIGWRTALIQKKLGAHSLRGSCEAGGMPCLVRRAVENDPMGYRGKRLVGCCAVGMLEVGMLELYVPKGLSNPWRTWCPRQQSQSKGGGRGRELLKELNPPCMLPWPWDADSHVAGAKGQHSSRLDCWVCNCESTDTLPDLQASKSAYRGGLCVCMCPDSEICGAVHVSAWDLLFGE